MRSLFPFRKTLFILAIIFEGTILSCTKDPVGQVQDRKVSDEFKAYTIFDSASYWVYKKETSSVNNIDTVRITNVFKDRRFHIDQTEPNGFFYEAVEMYYKSSMTGITKGEITAGSPVGNSTMNENYRLYFNSGRYFSIFIPKYPFSEVQLLGINEGNYTNVEKLSEFYINNYKYTDVYHTSIKDYKDVSATDPDTVYMDFYIAKNHGLIKYSIIKPNTGINDVWSLQSFDLSQTD